MNYLYSSYLLLPVPTLKSSLTISIGNNNCNPLLCWEGIIIKNKFNIFFLSILFHFYLQLSHSFFYYTISHSLPLSLYLVAYLQCYPYVQLAPFISFHHDQHNYKSSISATKIYSPTFDFLISFVFLVCVSLYLPIYLLLVTRVVSRVPPTPQSNFPLYVNLLRQFVSS